MDERKRARPKSSAFAYPSSRTMMLYGGNACVILPGGVCDGQRPGDLVPSAPDLIDQSCFHQRQPAARSTVVGFHHDEHAASALADVVNDDVRVVSARAAAALTKASGGPRCILREVCGQQLDATPATAQVCLPPMHFHTTGTQSGQVQW